jgi:hypothetical protein
MTPSRPPLTATPLTGNRGLRLSTWFTRRFVRRWEGLADRLHVLGLEPPFFANGAEVGGARERALGSPTHPLTHRGAGGEKREGRALRRP